MGDRKIGEPLCIAAENRRRERHDCLRAVALGRIEAGGHVRGAVHLQHLKLYPERCGGGLDRRHLQHANRGIVQYGEPTQPWERLSQQLQPFGTDLGKIEEYAGQITTGAREACHESSRHRISFEIQRDDRNDSCRGSCSLLGRPRRSNQDCHLIAGKLRSKRPEPFRLEIRPAYQPNEVSVFGIPLFADTLG